MTTIIDLKAYFKKTSLASHSFSLFFERKHLVEVPLTSLIRIIVITICINQGSILSAQIPSFPRPCGIYSLSSGGNALGNPLGNIRDYEYIDGFALRYGWRKIETSDGVYDFSIITEAVEILQGLDQKLTLALFTASPPEFALDLPGVETWLDFTQKNGVLDTVRSPVPWNPVILTKLEDFFSALANHKIADASQGGALVSLKNHPVLGQVNVQVPGTAGFRDTDSQIRDIPGYDRTNITNGSIQAIQSCLDNFPNKFVYTAFFGVSDYISSPNLKTHLIGEFNLAFNSASEPSLGYFLENLGCSSPATNSSNVLSENRENTFTMFQALQGWQSPFSNPSKTDFCTTDTTGPDVGMQYAVDSFNCTYFELYVADLDHPGYASLLNSWHGIIENLCPSAVLSLDVSLKIDLPNDEASLSGTITIEGTSNNATAISVSVDGGAFFPANGTDNWNFIIEDREYPPGDHKIVAIANGTSGDFAHDSINIVIEQPEQGDQQSFTYTSSVDNESMTSKLWIPDGIDTNTDDLPLLVWLHGGGGQGNFNPTVRAELDARGWIGIAPDGRHWGLHDRGCPWETSAAYVNNPDPDVGPGETDIFDAIQWVIDHYDIDISRIYLAGHSMGGRGTYVIGLKNPDRFAAIAPNAPAIDMYEIYVRRPQPDACKAGMVGGNPGDSDFVNTMYSITSGRFLIENAYNLPIFHGHGYLDPIANNDPTNAPFLHGAHIVNDTTWDACFDGNKFCFGHTPTLSELHTLHPDGYDWAYMFTPTKHGVSSKHLTGTAITSDIFGTEDPLNPGQLIGSFEFLSRHTLNPNPDHLVYKSYTDTHTKAYWASIDISTPWLNIPGAIRASRDAVTNTIDLEMVRVDTVTLDLQLMGLTIGDLPLTINVGELIESVFDPVLLTTNESLQPTYVLTGDFKDLAEMGVSVDGAVMPESSFQYNDSVLIISSLPIENTTEIIITQGGTTALSSVDLESQIRIHPNPTKGLATINIRNQHLPKTSRIEVHDFLGRKLKVQIKEHQNNGYELDLRHLTSGIYWISIRAGKDRNIKKLVLTK